jgi:A/G-specific adenine glycosylase
MSSKVTVKSQKLELKIQKLRNTVWDHFKKNGRHDFAWRKTKDPYHILVSEIMLQQTQVDRIIPYYAKFLREFPTIQALERSDLSRVLQAWSGLGYNRRAKMLRDCASAVVEKWGGTLPKERAALESLPGIGPYTAGAIRAFAFNEPDVFIETNIRTALTHHFFPKVSNVLDRALLIFLAEASRGQDPRTWYWALMDYGTYLKRSGVRINAKSKHYVKQARFAGSLREVRGAILRAHLKKTPLQEIAKQFPTHFKRAHASLQKDGLI